MGTRGKYMSSVQLKIKSRPEWNDVFVDEEHIETLKEFGWRSHSGGYLTSDTPKNWRGIIQSKAVYLHRLVWFLNNGEWPKQDIDHKDRDRHNNTITNLRPVSDSENMKNQKQQKRTIGGKMGVRWLEKLRCWRSDIGVRKDGKFLMIYSSCTKDKYIAELAQDCLRYLVGGYTWYHHPEFTFKDKWDWIGEKQRKQILHSFARNGFSDACGCVQ
jgi:hypothetical protein